ncbi:hypothetical protein IV203_018773 [Nitzschia inconspicua]|uniref:Uncharacterized protein n=1 Tax=Nitzschia inconspicua TaxID=303405 RepID=A0A9K3M3H7_9STRA|nr:hypothetical protein IV203_018773 [Nitzschia inconspicua]
MKRPYKNLNEEIDEIHSNTSAESSSIVIEMDDCTYGTTIAEASFSKDSRPQRKRYRMVSAPNSRYGSPLSILAKTTGPILGPISSAIQIADRIPTLCHEIPPDVVSRSASDESSLPANGPSPMPIKLIVFSKLPQKSCMECFLPPVLPKGQPLMRPPRLPTNLQPRQILLPNKDHLQSQNHK